MVELTQRSVLARWPHAVVLLLGLWMILSPLALGHFEAETMQNVARDVTAERAVSEAATRGMLAGINAIVTGVLIVALAGLSLRGRHAWAPWVTLLVGVWLIYAPLVFWAPTFALYANDTAVGFAVILLVLVMSRLPGTSGAALDDPSDVPPGWTYSPSVFRQRLPIIVLALVCVAFAVPMTAFQLGHIEGLPDPFFGGFAGLNGTETVLSSDVSEAIPVSDAGLGVTAYLIEVLLGLQGGRRRWRTSPWSVAMFGAVVVPLGVVSITFIIIQPILIGTYCTFCLVTAGAMLIMIPFAVDEAIATVQFVWRRWRSGAPLLVTFFRGGTIAGSRSSEGRPPEEPYFTWSLVDMGRGITLPWNLLLAATTGALLMLSPIVTGHDAPLVDTLHLVGSLAVTVSVIAMAEPVRALRFLDVPLGLWLLAAPWLVADATAAGTLLSVGGGALLVLFGLPRGRRSDDRYGGWDRVVV